MVLRFTIPSVLLGKWKHYAKYEASLFYVFGNWRPILAISAKISLCASNMRFYSKKTTHHLGRMTVAPV